MNMNDANKIKNPKILYEALKEPFNPKVIHWRVGATSKDKSKGIALA